MFLSLSKTLARFGGMRLGLGIRITKQNALIMAFVYLFVLMFQLTWYMLVVCFWLGYAVCYGSYLCIKKMVQAIKGHNAHQNQAS